MPVQSIDVDEHPDLASKYGVKSIPTFIVVARDGQVLARTKGVMSTGELASFYREAKRKIAQQPRSNSDEGWKGDDDEARPGFEDDDAHERAVEEASTDEDRPRSNKADEDEPASPPRRRNPDPWATVVRIKVHGNGMIGYGSGTVIASDSEQSVILTCAHIFHIEGAAKQPNPKRFPLKVTVDLFDGKIRQLKPAVVGCVVKDVEARVVDYDAASDVGLMIIRPGKQLPYARVAPPTWQPKVDMDMTTVGCSGGRDATAWSTKITQIGKFNIPGKTSYSAIECDHAPMQGRSGGGLFTTDGDIAGVCNFAFADPRYQRGLYASPRSIYKMLDKNNLAGLYDPSAKGEMLASKSGSKVIVRGQSPDEETPKLRKFSLPPHDMLGLRTEPQSEGRTTRRTGWEPNTKSTNPNRDDRASRAFAEKRSFKPIDSESLEAGEPGEAVTTNLAIDRSDDPDAAPAELSSVGTRVKTAPSGGWHSAKP